MKRGIGYIARKDVTKSDHLIDTWKVLVPKAFNGGDALPHQILGKPLIVPSPSVCTQSFLFFHVGSQKAANSLQSYYSTRFFRFLVSLRKITQDATHSCLHMGSGSGMEPDVDGRRTVCKVQHYEA